MLVSRSVLPRTSTDLVDVDHRVTISEAPFEARASWGDQLLATSTDAIRVEEPGRAPDLYFPTAAVRSDLLRDEGHTLECPVKGTARLWSVESLDHDHGQDVAWVFTDPSPGLDRLTDHVAFDHERIRVEVLDAMPGGAAAVTVKAFPTWGDASDLIDLLDVQPDGAGGFVSSSKTDWRRPVVEGSQLLGQAIVAASRHRPDRRVVSAHMVFTRPADAARAVNLELDEFADGRSFTALTVRVTQDGRRCAAGTLLLDVTAPDVIRHAVDAPSVAAPLDCPTFDMSVTGRDVRFVDDAYTGDPDAAVGPPVIDAWVRFAEVPDDPCLHAALLAQFTGHVSIAAAMRPHAGIGQDQAHRTLSTAINAIGISFHGEPRADRWMLYRHHATFAGDGMTHSECRVHTESGDLLASFTVDAMVRAFAPTATARDETRAL